MTNVRCTKNTNIPDVSFRCVVYSCSVCGILSSYMSFGLFVENVPVKTIKSYRFECFVSPETNTKQTWATTPSWSI